MFGFERTTFWSSGLMAIAMLQLERSEAAQKRKAELRAANEEVKVHQPLIRREEPPTEPPVNELTFGGGDTLLFPPQ